MKMMWVGLDVHKGFTRVGGFDPATGEVQDLGQVPTDQEYLIEALELLPEPKAVVLEAGRKSWAIAGWLESHAQQVWVVDPGEVRRLQHRLPKTDRRDAAALARLGAKGLLEPLWRPDAADLNLRELTRGRIALVRTGTRLRNMIRSLCARHGEELPQGDLLGEKQQQRLSQVQLPPYAQLSLQTFTELLVLVQALVERFAEPMQREATADARAQRLMTIPGIGANLGLTIAVEIGQVSRFPSPAHLRSYSGLCPQVYASGGRMHHGRLTKVGNRWLRWALVMAAQHIANSRRGCDSRLKRLLKRTTVRHGRNPAKVACARGLLDLIHHLETHEEDWQPPRDKAA
jgi:transposase